MRGHERALVMRKDRALLRVLARLEEQLGRGSFRVVDHWSDDPRAVGIARVDDSGCLAYVAIDDDARLYVALEGPPIDPELPYRPTGDAVDVNEERLLAMVEQHLDLPTKDVDALLEQLDDDTGFERCAALLRLHRGSGSAKVHRVRDALVARAHRTAPAAAIAALSEAGVRILEDAHEPVGELHRAAQVGDLDRVRALLADGCDPNARDADGWTPLLHAAYADHVSVVRVLLDAGADVTASANGTEALDYALNREDRRPLLACLLDAGARFDDDAVYLAAKHPGLLNALLSRDAEVNAKTEQGETALSFAASWGHRASAEVLLAWGADPNHVVPDLDWSVLMFAAEHGDPEVVATLLAGGADATWTNRHGYSALYVALDHGRRAVAEHLITACPSTARATTFDPAAIARRRGDTELATRLTTMRWSEPLDGVRARLEYDSAEGSVAIVVENVADHDVVVVTGDPTRVKLRATRDGADLRPALERMDVMYTPRRVALSPAETCAWRLSMSSTREGVIDLVTRGFKPPFPLHATLSTAGGELTLLPVEISAARS